MSVGNATTARSKLNSIQVLRGLAAIMVTIAHASEEAKYFFSFNPLFDTTPLGKGVDLFFVISGFIIYYSSTSLFGTKGGVSTFLYNRISRVVPLYFLFTTLMVAVVLFIPSGVKEARLDVWQIVSSYTFIPFERYDGRIAPILSLGWTLNYEVFFYLLFACVMWLPAKRAALASVGIMLSLTILGLFVSPDAPAPVRAWTFNIILEFSMGVLIALAYERFGKKYSIPLWQASVIILLGMLALYFLNLPGYFEWLPRFVSAGLPMAVVVGTASLLVSERVEFIIPRWSIGLGDSSYSLYLSHRFVQRPIQIVLTRLTLDPIIAGGLYMLLAVSGAVLAGHVLFLTLERPLLRRLRRKRGDRQSAIIETSDAARPK